jgi:AcrR family transcriptional regulator
LTFTSRVNWDSFLAMSYRRTEATQARLDDNRTRILMAARKIVAEVGWRPANVAAVAQVAGLATGTVYRYFSSKAELFAEVLSDVSRRERDIVAAIVDGEGAADARLTDAVEVFASRALQGRRLAYALIGEPCDPEIDKARLVWRAALSEEFVRLIEAGQKDGSFRRCNARIAGACVAGALMEALAGPLAPERIDGPQEVKSLASEIAEACLAMVASNPGKPPRQFRSVK